MKRLLLFMVAILVTANLIGQDCSPDVEVPTIECSPKIISIVAGEQLEMASTFIDDAQDNCDMDLTLEVRRMDPNNGPDDNWAAGITITCEDVDNTGAQTLDVEVRAVDDAGNVSTICMSSNQIHDKLPPVIMTELPDITVGCDYVYDLTDLEEFGSMVGSAAEVEPITIDDGAGPMEVGEDGMFIESCLDEVVENVTTDLDDCGIGTITRAFIITDTQGNADTTYQEITIELRNTFDPATGVEWPETYTYFGCTGDSPDPSESGTPNILYNGCSQLSLPEYTDMEFHHPDGGCTKILRMWRIMDWCIFDPITEEGLYTHTQVIKMMDNVYPVMAAGVCDAETFGTYSETCDVQVASTALATDNCTELTDSSYSYSLEDADGNEILNGDGPVFSETLGIGTYTLVWSVNDYCGNITRCEKPITVADVKAPSIICMQGLVLNLNQMSDENGNTIVMANVPANCLVKETSDFCTEDSEIKISFSPDPTDTLWAVNCAHEGVQTVTIYVTDTYGNQDFCTTTVTVQDNFNLCPDPQPITISGKVTTENNIPLEGIKTVLKGQESHNEVTTDAQGRYAFNDMPVLAPYEVSVDPMITNREGVSVIDLVVIQRHILGTEIMTSPYKMIAADVDGSQSITPIDLIHLRKYILGIDDNFPTLTDWVMVDKAGQALLSDPCMTDEKININPGTQDINNADFVGIKLGDVNGSYEQLLSQNADARNEAIKYLDYTLENEKATYKTTVSGPISALQMTIPTSSTVNITGISSDILNEEDFDYYIGDQEVSIIWFHPTPVNFEEGQQLFEINGSGLDGLIHARTRASRMYDGRDDEFQVILRESENNLGYALSQNYPNPFTEESYVDMNLPETANVTFTVLNQNGQVVSKRTSQYGTGDHRINVSELIGNNHFGVFMLRAETNRFTKTIRLIRVK